MKKTTAIISALLGIVLLAGCGQDQTPLAQKPISRQSKVTDTLPTPAEAQPIVPTSVEKSQPTPTPKQVNQPSSTTPTSRAQAENHTESPFLLTKEYLVSTKWGPEKGVEGTYIEFYNDSTFMSYFGGPTGDLPTYGNFEIQGNTVILNNTKYGNIPFSEAQEKFNFYGPNRIVLTSGETNNSLYFTRYLAENGKIYYWDWHSKVPEGSIRHLDNNILVITHKNLKPKTNASAKNYPGLRGQNYSFHCVAGLGDSCFSGDNHIAEVAHGTLARTQFKEKINGVEDYWYLMDILLPGMAFMKLNNIENISPFWVHGSELQ